MRADEIAACGCIAVKVGVLWDAGQNHVLWFFSFGSRIFADYYSDQDVHIKGINSFSSIFGSEFRTEDFRGLVPIRSISIRCHP